MGKQQLPIRNLCEAGAYRTVGIRDDSSKRIVHQAIEAGYREYLAIGSVWIRTCHRQTLHPRPEIIPLRGAAERQMRSFLADIFRVDQDVARQLPLEPKAPALLIGRLIRTRRSEEHTSELQS